MFGQDDSSLSNTFDELKSKVTRSQDEECDFCSSSEGSVIVSREEVHPDVSSSPPVVRCKTCYNDPDTYPEQ